MMRIQNQLSSDVVDVVKDEVSAGIGQYISQTLKPEDFINQQVGQSGIYQHLTFTNNQVLKANIMSSIAAGTNIINDQVESVAIDNFVGNMLNSLNNNTSNPTSTPTSPQVSSSPNQTFTTSPTTTLPPSSTQTTTPVTKVTGMCNFTRALSVGSIGYDVLCLQQYLNASGFIITLSGSGSPGHETNYFGNATANAIIKWQTANGISPASGYFGSVSEVKYNSLFSSTFTTNTQTPPQNTTPTIASPSTPTTTNTTTPTASIMSNNNNIYPGSGTIISWTSTNTSTCTVSPTNWSGTSSGGYLQTPQVTTIYTLTCLSPGGTISKSVTVTVIPNPTTQTPVQMPTNWTTLLNQNIPIWTAKGYAWGYITDSYGVTQYYQLQKNNWVQVASQAIAETPYNAVPLYITINNTNEQLSVGTMLSNVYFSAPGGASTYTWTATGLPPGLSLGSNNGYLTGTPTTAGSYTTTVTATNTFGLPVVQSYTFTVGANTTPLTIEDSNANTTSSETLPSAVFGSAYSYQLDAYGGAQTQNGYTWTTQGTLPPGVTAGTPFCGGGTCTYLQISGTPTQAGTYTFQLIATDSTGATAQKSITIIVNSSTPPQITSPYLTQATVGQPYNYTFNATGGSGGYKWSFSGNSPDSGLQLSSDGILSGTPANPNDCQNGVWNAPYAWKALNESGPPPSVSFTITVTDSSGQSTSTQPLCLVSYYPQPQVTAISPQSITVDGSQHTLTVTGSNFRSDAMIGISAANILVPTTYINSSTLSFTLYPSSLNGGGFTITPSSNSVFTANPELVSVDQSYSKLSNKLPWTIASP